jgi:hypothetical protein
MENKILGVAIWRRELHEEEHKALENLVNSLQIRLNNASTQWKTMIDLLVEQSQGY